MASGVPLGRQGRNTAGLVQFALPSSSVHHGSCEVLIGFPTDLQIGEAIETEREMERGLTQGRPTLLSDHTALPGYSDALLVAQRFNRIQGCGLVSRIVAEEDADGGCKTERDNY